MYNTKNKTQKAYKKNKPNLNLIPKNCVCVFPIEIVGGKTQVSNLGIMPNRRAYDKGSFLYGQEVFDGRSALKLQGQDSITLEKPEGQNYYLAKPSIGKYYYGKPISNGTESLEISEDASFEDFMSMKASQTVTLRFEYTPTNRESSKGELQKLFRFNLVDNDIYNLYQIPELCEEKLMYISEHQEYYDDATGLVKGCEITFATLGDKIQKSGKAIEQYCSWNAPGEFSVRPKVIDYYDFETEEGEKQVIYDPVAYYYPTPVKYLQVEQQGPALTSTIYALGRRQEGVEVEDPETHETTGYGKIGPSKILLPYQFVTTQPNPLNRTSTPSKNFFCLPDEQVTMVTNNECLQGLFDKATQPLEQVKNAGMISIGDNWERSGTELPTDNKSNPTIAGIRKDYFDGTGLPLSYQGAYLTAHDTSGCVYADSSIGHTATDTMIDIMCKNAFIYNSQPIIPLSFYSTRPFYLRDIPLVGTIANFFKLGDIKLTNNTTSRKATSLCLFGDADIISMCSQLQGQMGTTFKPNSCVFPINFFGTNEAMYQKLGVNSVNTTFCFSLTDQVSIDNTVGDTIYLGQSTREDGTELFPETHQSLLVNSSLKPVYPTSYNFILDAIVVQSIFDGKIRLSCYGEEEREFIYPQGTATILSNANWENGNMRDGTNVFLLSNGEERFCVQEDEFTWPQAPHKKEITENYVGEVNVEENFEYTWNGNQTQPNTGQDVANSGGSNTQAIPGITGQQVTKNKVLFEGTKSYNDLGVASVTDKDSFIQHYKSFDFNFIGSLLTVVNKGTEVKDRTLGSDFVTGIYSYNKIVDICSIRYNKGQNKLQLNNADFHTVPVVTRFASLSPFFKGTFDQQLELQLVLGDSAITYKIIDKSFCQAFNTTTQYNKKILNMARGFVFGTPEPFKSIVKSQDITFYKR